MEQETESMKQKAWNMEQGTEIRQKENRPKAGF